MKETHIKDGDTFGLLGMTNITPTVQMNIISKPNIHDTLHQLANDLLVIKQALEKQEKDRLAVIQATEKLEEDLNQFAESLNEG